MTPAQPHSPQAGQRARHLDGMRGWAALMVVLCHLVYESLGIVMPGARLVWFRPFMDGQLAVSVFFVLSGTALSAPYFRRRDFGDLIPIILTRYFRLAIPITLSCLLVWALMKAHLSFNHEAGQILHRPDWLGSWLQFEPNLFRMVRFAWMEVFGSVDGTQSYNPFLWTMSLELFGSLLVFVLCAAYPHVGDRPALYLGAAALFIALGGHVGLFIVGFYLGAQGLGVRAPHSEARGASALWPWLGVVGLVVLVQLLTGHIQVVADMALAVALCVAVYRSPRACAWLSRPMSAWLGKVSFAVYWVQFPVLVSAFSYGITRLQGSGQLTPVHASGLVAASFVLILLAADLGTRVEQRLLQRVKVQVARWSSVPA